MSAEGIGKDLLQDERIAAYVDRALPADEQLRFEEELARSPALRDAVEAYRGTVSLLRAQAAADPVVAPEDFLPGLQRRIRLKTRGRFYGVVRIPYDVILLVVVLAAVFYAGWAILTPQPARVTWTGSRRVVLAQPVDPSTATALGMTDVPLPEARDALRILVVGPDSLETARAALRDSLKPVDREWLDGLTLTPSQRVRLVLVPPSMSLVPVQLEPQAPH